MYAESIRSQLVRRGLKYLLAGLPSDQWRCAVRSSILRYRDSLHPDLLCRSGETVGLVGVHRIDTVMRWSEAVGSSGKVVVIEALPTYLDNISYNLETHLNWPLQNILFVPKGVSSQRAEGSMEVGSRADYNRLYGQGIVDDLQEDDFVDTVKVELDTMDSILADLSLEKVDHITMTISGMELEALQGMRDTMQRRGLRLLIRSLHTKDGKVNYPLVCDTLREAGFRVVEGKRVPGTAGRNIYAYKL